MTETDGRKDRVSRRAVLATLPVSALLGGFTGGAIASAVVEGRAPWLIGEEPPRPVATGTAIPPTPASGIRPFYEATDFGIVGDGTTDNARALNQLLESASSGYEILLPAGDYVIASRLKLRSGVSIVGAGADVTTLRLADGANSTFVLASAETGIRISGVTFDGGTQDAKEVALQFDTCNGILIEDCAFVRMSNAVHVYAAAFKTSGDITIRRNRFDEISDYAVRIGESADSVWIEGNTVVDVKKVNAPGPAAFYLRGTNMTVVGNTVLASDDTGIMVAGGAARNIRIVGNVITSTLVCIYYGTGASEGTITGNSLLSRQDFGVHLFDRDGSSSRTIVTQNHTLSTGKSGIQVEGVTDIVISSNMIFNPGTRDGMTEAWRCGLGFITTAGGPAGRFVVESNVIVSDQGASRMEYGILLASKSSGVRVSGNIVSGAIGNDVDLQDSLQAPYYVETASEILSSRTFSTP